MFANNLTVTIVAEGDFLFQVDEKCLVEIFCEVQMDGYEKAVGESFTKLAFEAVEKIINVSWETPALCAIDFEFVRVLVDMFGYYSVKITRYCCPDSDVVMPLTLFLNYSLYDYKLVGFKIHLPSADNIKIK